MTAMSFPLFSRSRLKRIGFAFRFVWRSFGILWVLVNVLLGYAWKRLRAGRQSPTDREVLRGQAMALACERLGACFIKFGQILSTRPDLLGPGYIEALSRLQDQVPGEDISAIQTVLKRELPKRYQDLHLEEKPLAAASVAQVHAGRLPSGESVAIKIQRPFVEKKLLADVEILQFWAKFLNLFPPLKPLSLPRAASHFGEALKQQLDFRVEARNNERFQANFKDVDGVKFPRLYKDWCSQRVLTMERIVGVRASEPEKVGKNRTELARKGAEAILKMVFEDGFVHADLHPGNIMLTEDGTIYMIDLGLVAEIPDDLIQLWLETLISVGQKNGKEVARLLYVHAPEVKPLDYAAYEKECVDWFALFEDKAIGEIESAVVVGGVMNILRRYGVYIDPSFTVVHVAMVVAEGLGKQLDPDLDLIQMALPVITKALAKAPKGREPKRQPPPH